MFGCFSFGNFEITDVAGSAGQSRQRQNLRLRCRQLPQVARPEETWHQRVWRSECPVVHPPSLRGQVGAGLPDEAWIFCVACAALGVSALRLPALPLWLQETQLSPLAKLRRLAWTCAGPRPRPLWRLLQGRSHRESISEFCDLLWGLRTHSRW